MSVKIMAQVFDGDLPPLKRLVMLSLADHAGDDGVCYPSIARLCLRTGLSERAVQKHIAELVASGHISREMNAGKRGCNVYTLTTAPCAPPHGVHPAPRAPNPRTACTPTPARRAPEPSSNHQEPSEVAVAARARETEITDRDRYLAACGLDYTGMTGHGSARLGTAADMEIARKWTAAPPDGLGLTVDDCVQVIREVVTRGTTPRRFAYFDGAMAELAAARRRPAPPMKPEKGYANERSSPRRPAADADRAAAEARQALADGRITSVIAGPFAPGASRRR